MRLIILLALSIPSILWAAEKKAPITPATETTTPNVETPALRPGNEAKSDPVPSPDIQDEDERLRFGLGLFYHGGDKLSFKDVDTATAGKQDIDFGIDKSAGVVVSMQYLPSDSWGFIGSLNFEGARKIKSTTTSGTTTFDGTGDKLTILTVDGSLAYRWQHFYIPFGLNISGYTWKADQSGANIKTRGSMGLQFGAGWMITQNLAADVIWKSIGLGFDEDYGGPKTEYQIGILSGAYVDLRWIF